VREERQSGAGGGDGEEPLVPLDPVVHVLSGVEEAEGGAEGHVADDVEGEELGDDGEVHGAIGGAGPGGGGDVFGGDEVEEAGELAVDGCFLHAVLKLVSIDRIGRMG
jgi:hypothetical protein